MRDPIIPAVSPNLVGSTHTLDTLVLFFLLSHVGLKFTQLYSS